MAKIKHTSDIKEMIGARAKGGIASRVRPLRADFVILVRPSYWRHIA